MLWTQSTRQYQVLVVRWIRDLKSIEEYALQKQAYISRLLYIIFAVGVILNKVTLLSIHHIS